MQLDFKALEQALAPIAEIGQGELTFDVGGTPVTVRVLRPSEEVEAQKYASVALEGDADHAAVDYLDRFRLACLSHAIVAVGNQDFRNVDYVTTGAKLDNGTEIKVPKHKAMRDLLGRWTRAALSGVFNKFHELLAKTEKEAEQAIVFEPSDIPSEIERLQQRIADLKGDMEKAKVAELTKFTATVEQAQALAQEKAQVAPPAPEAPPEEVPEPSPARGPVRRAPITPQRAAPPPVVQVPPPPPPSQQAAAPQPSAPPAPQAPPPRPDSSFVNFDDDDGVHAAMEAETQRLLEMRRRAARNQQPQDEGGALDQVRHRRPPHLDALEAEEEIGVTQAAAMRAREVGVTPDGTPVFALPAQDLDTPSFRGRPSAGPLNPQVRQGGATNPRFQRPNKP